MSKCNKNFTKDNSVYFLHQLKIKTCYTCVLLFYREVLNLKIILTDGFILSTHQRLCRPIHELDTCRYCEIRNEVGIKIIKNAIVTFESQFAEAMIISIMNEPDDLTTNQSLKILVSVTIPLVIQW